jgi:hypothetical protein
MQKWSFYSAGILSGVVAVLLTVVVMQNREPQAHAVPPVPQAVDNTGQGLIMGIGASQQNQNDIVWVLYKRNAPRKAGADTKDVVAKDEKLTLCAYQIANGARTMKLAAVRDISYDMDLLELGNDRPHVKDIVEELRKQLRAPDREK